MSIFGLAAGCATCRLLQLHRTCAPAGGSTTSRMHTTNSSVNGRRHSKSWEPPASWTERLLLQRQIGSCSLPHITGVVTEHPQQVTDIRGTRFH